MSETMDQARALHVFKNGLDISGVLQSVQETQIPLMRQAIASKMSSTFTSAYGETLDACNGCHRSAGYGFISIMPPTAPPVTKSTLGCAEMIAQMDADSPQIEISHVITQMGTDLTQIEIRM